MRETFCVKSTFKPTNSIASVKTTLGDRVTENFASSKFSNLIKLIFRHFYKH